MPTPLEKYLKEELPNRVYAKNSFAIGSDNIHSNSRLSTALRDGIKEFGGGRLTTMIPQTLAARCVDRREDWSPEINAAWIKRMVSSDDMRTVHIYHPKIARALYDSASPDQKVNPAHFANIFDGKLQSPTIDEVAEILFGGFLNIEAVSSLARRGEMGEDGQIAPEDEGRFERGIYHIMLSREAAP